MVWGHATPRAVPILATLLGTAVLLALMTAAIAAQRPGSSALAAGTIEPPLSMTCPMHPDVVEEQPGSCPLCKMTLVPVRLESSWTCPLHSVVSERSPGKCRICGRDLIQVTVSFTWSCLARPDINEINRGTCPDGSAMIPRRTVRAHGNHNPQHGGQFFMAPDTWHHLEGTYPRERTFRLYVYDDYSRPLAPEKLAHVSGRVVTKENFDAATRTAAEATAFPLALARTGTYLEARIDGVPLPAQMTAKVRLKTDGPEYRFDFTFASLSKDATPEPVAAARRSSTAKAAPGTTAAPPPPPSADPGLIATAIPETVADIVTQLQTRRDEIRDLIDRGNFAAVFVPAFQAKDLAIALEGRMAALAPPQRQTAEPAIRALVRTAWLLDAVGDLGNRDQIVTAYDAFASTVADVTRAFSQ